MAVITDFSTLSRAELQKMCKSAGLRATGKTEVLIEQLKRVQATRPPSTQLSRPTQAIAVKAEAEAAPKPKPVARRAVSVAPVRPPAPPPAPTQKLSPRKSAVAMRRARAKTPEPSSTSPRATGEDVTDSGAEVSPVLPHSATMPLLPRSPTRPTTMQEQLACIRHDITELVEQSRPLDGDAQIRSETDRSTLSQLIDAKLEAHKRDVLALVDSKLRAFEADLTASRFALELRSPSQLGASLPRSPTKLGEGKIRLGSSQSAMLASPPPRAISPIPPVPAVPEALRSPEKRKRAMSIDSVVSIDHVAASTAEPIEPELATAHIRKKIRVEEVQKDDVVMQDVTATPAAPAAVAGPITSTPMPALALPLPAPSSTFSFFRRSLGGTMHSPPAYPSSEAVKGKDTRIAALPFPITAVSPRAPARTAVSTSEVAPTPPPASKTLFGTEREGGRFGDNGGASPSRKWRWANWGASA